MHSRRIKERYDRENTKWERAAFAHSGSDTISREYDKVNGIIGSISLPIRLFARQRGSFAPPSTQFCASLHRDASSRNPFCIRRRTKKTRRLVHKSRGFVFPICPIASISAGFGRAFIAPASKWDFYRNNFSPFLICRRINRYKLWISTFIVFQRLRTIS